MRHLGRRYDFQFSWSKVVHLRTKTPITIKKSYPIKVFSNHTHFSLTANPDRSILMRGQTTHNSHCSPFLNSIHLVVPPLFHLLSILEYICIIISRG